MVVTFIVEMFLNNTFTIAYYIIVKVKCKKAKKRKMVLSEFCGIF